ncbi:Protein maelstrom-like protein [Acropora cervicornis]|uniref:Protein maelstrom-like protein n=1 Tax=Acropora cervicornis TaxID=6130 RepID=A0AAD9QT09_ACRCE|nr:Protein maelstrom-like protein [Acropora cervicornis]
MPNKKKNNAPKNAFYFFMVSLRPRLERQGVVLENGMQSLAEIAGPRWKELSEDEKEVYQEMARQSKANKKYQPARNDRMDCTGQYLSKRVDIVSLNEKRRKEEREDVKRRWASGRAVCDEKFFMIGFMSYYNLPDEGYLPCELGAVEYSLNGGILRRLHYFIPPGELKVGLRYAAMSTSERTHQIPIEGLAKKGDTYRKIWLELLRFVNPEQTAIFPPVYCRISETKQTEFCLQYLSKKAEMANKLKKVYELEGLVCDLHAHFTAESGSTMAISKSKATDLISSTIFDYEPNTRCDWHEKHEIKFCALGTVQRYCYCMSDFLCSVYGIPLTPSHLPERPEGAFGTAIHAPEISWSTQKERHFRDTGQSMEDNRAFASRDYYCNGGATALVSLTSTDDDDDSEYSAPQGAATGASQLYHAQVSHSQQTSSGFGIGRGRGRGRGIQPSQPLRRPNMPGAAGGATAKSQDTSWSNVASSQPPSASLSSIPAWTRIENQPPSAGRGALRAPATRPKVYAGALNPPGASQAPMPPPAWQMQVWQGGRGVASKMSALNLND